MDSEARAEQLISLYRSLRRTYPLGSGWPDGKWPLGHGFQPPRLEVVVGAILTQNVSWSNVEKGLDRMVAGGLTTTPAIARAPLLRLEEAIRPTGFFRQKALRLQGMARFMLGHEDFFGGVTRQELLALDGVGPETADSILLYACDRPRFVVDAYTFRLLGRYGLAGEGAGYDQVQSLFQDHLPRGLDLYRRFHALIVEHAKRTCRKTPLCGECVLEGECSWPQRPGGGGERRYRSRKSST